MRTLSRSAILLGAFIALCGWSGVAQAVLNVFTCEPEWAALAKELGGDQLDIYSATTALQDPHHIQARPSLIAKARKADLLICTGAELEIGWLPLLLRKAGNARIQVGQAGHFLAAEHVDMLEVPEKLDRSLGDVHASGNPHVHADPRNIARVAGQLHQRLVEIDPGHADIYEKRYGVFDRDWQSAINKWNKQAAMFNGADVVVHHDYWSYLLEWSGLNKLATLEPVPGVSPTTRHLSQVKKLLKNNKAAMIIDTNYMNDRPVKWLAEQTNLPVVTLPATVDYQGGETLHQWFDNLVELVQEPVK